MRKIGDFMLVDNKFMKRIGLIWWFEGPRKHSDPNNPWHKARLKEFMLRFEDQSAEMELWEENLKMATHEMPETTQ